MELAVVIPTKNEEENLLYLVNSIKSQTFKDLIIVVADAFSTDNTRKIAKKAGAIVVDGGYPSKGRNSGARKAVALGAEVLVFIDADIILPSVDFLKNALEEFNKRKLDVAGTLQKSLSLNHKINPKRPIETSVKSKDFRYNAFCNIPNYFIKRSQYKKRPFMQQCMFVKSKIFDSKGGFDETVEFGEDQLYAQYLVKKGSTFGVLEKSGKIWASPRRLKNKGFFKVLFLNLFYIFLISIGYKIRRGGKLKYF